MMIISIHCNNNIQDNIVSINQRNTSLYKVCEYLNNYYQVGIYINTGEDISIHNINIDNQKLEDVMRRISQICNIKYEIIDNNIYITKIDLNEQKYKFNTIITENIWNDIISYAQNININIDKINNTIWFKGDEKLNKNFQEYCENIDRNINKQIKICLKVIHLCTNQTNVSELDQTVKTIFKSAQNMQNKYLENKTKNAPSKPITNMNYIVNGISDILQSNKNSGNIDINLESNTIIFIQNHHTGTMTHTTSSKDENIGFNFTITPHVYGEDINIEINYEYFNNINITESSTIKTKINILENQEYIIGSQTSKFKTMHKTQFTNIPILKQLLFFLNKDITTNKIKQYFFIIEVQIV